MSMLKKLTNIFKIRGGGFVLALFISMLLSSSAFGAAVTINISGITDGAGDSIASGAYVQVIQSSDGTAGDPDEDGNPSGDTIVVTGSISPAGTFASGASITANYYVYIRVWETWDGTGSPSGNYGTSSPEDVGSGFVYTYSPSGFSADTEFGASETPGISSIDWADGDDSGYIYGSLNVTGTNFGTAEDTVQIDSLTVDSDQLYYWDATTIVVGVFPSLEGEYLVAGDHSLTVTVDGSESSPESFALKPRIYGFDVSSGGPGDTVTITGTAFGTDESSVSVAFGDASTTATTADNTSLTVSIPDDVETGTTVEVIVTINEKESGSMSFEVESDASQPALSVDSTSLSFTSYVGASSTSPTSRTITISNSQSGTGSFDLTASTAADWLTLSASSGSVSDTDPLEISVTVDLDGLTDTAATHETTITIEADDDSVQGSPQEITVTLTVLEVNGPTISTLSFNLGPAGSSLVISGMDFGDTQGTSQVLFTKDGASTAGTVTSWSDSEIVLQVPFSLTKGSYDVEIYKLSIAAEGIEVASKSDAVSYFVTAAASVGTANTYPNPFNPVTESITIQFNPGSATNIGVYIYDATARLVKTEILSGASSTTWDGRDLSGAIVGDGVYLVRIVNEGTKALISKGKILVIKR